MILDVQTDEWMLNGTHAVLVTTVETSTHHPNTLILNGRPWTDAPQRSVVFNVWATGHELYTIWIAGGRITLGGHLVTWDAIRAYLHKHHGIATLAHLINDPFTYPLTLSPGRA